MYILKAGEGCVLKMRLVEANGAPIELRNARFVQAILHLPNEATMLCEDVRFDEVSQLVFVRLSAKSELTMEGVYGININALFDGRVVTSAVLDFAEVKANTESGYFELLIDLLVSTTDVPSCVKYTGASPKISKNGTWLVFNDEINAFEDTGISIFGKSAYQAAIESGNFSGTEEEFNAYMGSIPQITNDAMLATESANKATENANNAGAEAVRIATESAQEATTAKENAEQATEQAKEATANANSAAQRANEEVQNLREKADIDGYYPDMTVGKADSLVGRGDTQDAVINFRPSGGIPDVGNGMNITDGTARIKAIKGNSVVYNQGAYRTKTQTWSGGSTSFLSEGVVEFTGITNATSISVGTTYKMVPNHLYLNIVEVLSMGQVENMSFGNSNLVNGRYTFTEAGIYQSISKNTRNDYSYIGITGVAIGTDMTGVKVRYRVINLTQMFGVDNEPKSYEEYLQRKPINIADEFAYNEGELIDMKVDSLVSVGDNLLNFTNEIVNAPYISDASLPATFEPNTIYKGVAINGLTDSHYIKDVSISGNEVSITGQYGYGLGLFITALPSYQYILQSEHSYRIALLFYDEQKTMISAKYSDSSSINVVSPTNTHYCMVVLAGNNNTVHTYMNTILSLAHSGYKIGEYKPYEQDAKDLSWIKEYFPNGMRSAGSVYDEIRYDVTKKKWVAEKRMDKVVIDSYTNIVKDTNHPNAFTVKYQDLGISSTAKTYGSGANLNNYSLPNSWDVNNKGVYFTTSQILVINLGEESGITTVEQFKQKLSSLPFEMVFEIVPIEEEIPNSENWNLDYLVWDFGTEEALVRDSTIDNLIPSAPFRADINYEPNAVDDLRWSIKYIRALEARVLALEQKQNAIESNLTD